MRSVTAQPAGCTRKSQRAEMSGRLALLSFGDKPLSTMQITNATILSIWNWRTELSSNVVDVIETLCCVYVKSVCVCVCEF